MSRAQYMREWRLKREKQRRNALRFDNRDLFRVIGLDQSPRSSMELWNRPGVFIRVIPSGWHIGYFGRESA